MVEDTQFSCSGSSSSLVQSPEDARARLSSVRGVLVSLPNVLIDATHWRRWLFRLLTRFGVHTHFQSLFRIWECV